MDSLQGSLENIDNISDKSITQSNYDYEKNVHDNTQTVADYNVSLCPSYISVLTKITQISEEDLNKNLPICLLFTQESNSQIIEDNTFNFPPNIDPGISAYMNYVDTDKITGWKKYVKECYKYSIPRLTAVKDVLDLKTSKLDLKVCFHGKKKTTKSFFFTELLPTKYWYFVSL